MAFRWGTRGGGDELAPFVLANIEGLKDDGEEAGRGAYGIIYNVTVNGLPYVAKRLHKALVKQVRKSEDMKKKFRTECITLSRLKHPNIVHFVGVHYGRDRNDLVLIMESLHCDLSEFLERHQQVLLPLKLSILLDVSYGLLYLHSHDPVIVHRDLTSRNILLTTDGHAKIADLGVAKLLTPQALMAFNTKAPGQPLYMPPETLTEKPECTPKIDIFSFGHLSIFTMNQEEPEVFEVMKISNANKKQGVIQALKRRRALERVGQDHCLYPLITQCLHDDPTRRPSTGELTKKMKELCTKFPKGAAEEGTNLTMMEKSAETQRHLLQLEKEKTDLQSQLEATNAQVAIFQADFDEERKDREKAHSKLADLEKELIQKKTLFIEENAEYKRRLTIAHKEAESAIMEYNRATKELEQSKLKCAELEASNKQLRAHLPISNKADKDEENQNDAAKPQEELTELKKQYHLLEIENDELRKQVKILKAFVEEQDKELKHIKTEAETSPQDESTKIKQQLQQTQYNEQHQAEDVQPAGQNLSLKADGARPDSVDITTRGRSISNPPQHFTPDFVASTPRPVNTLPGRYHQSPGSIQPTGMSRPANKLPGVSRPARMQPGVSHHPANVQPSISHSPTSSRHPAHFPLRATQSDATAPSGFIRQSNASNKGYHGDNHLPFVASAVGNNSQDSATDEVQMQGNLHQFSPPRDRHPVVASYRPHHENDLPQDSSRKSPTHNQQQQQQLFHYNQQFGYVQTHREKNSPGSPIIPQDPHVNQHEQHFHQSYLPHNGYYRRHNDQQDLDQRQSHDNPRQWIEPQKHTPNDNLARELQERRPDSPLQMLQHEHPQLMQSHASPQLLPAGTHQLDVTAQPEKHHQYQNIPYHGNQPYTNIFRPHSQSIIASNEHPAFISDHASSGTETNLNNQTCMNPLELEIKQLQTVDPVPQLVPQQSNTHESHNNDSEPRHDKLLQDDNQASPESFEERNSKSSMQADMEDVIRQFIDVPVDNVTDTRRPFDPNLICPMCNKPFRIGEIQRFRKHVNQCEGSEKNA